MRKVILNLFFSSLFSCQKEATIEALAYVSDFENGTLEGIEGGTLFPFLSSTLLGTFNNSGFTLKVDDLPSHELLTASFDLYLHDSWDGNTTEPDGPDLWFMEVVGKKIIDASFSNNPCASTYCLHQSFPENFRSFNNPRTGSSTSLHGLCHWSDLQDGTSVYQITKTIAHCESKVSFTFGDKLVQSNTCTPGCDESWSMGKIAVKVILIN